MGREQKKGKAGNARAYITRAKALKKLQLSLPEFRRLCILKGIFPRDPKKKVEGADKTYYLRKDIDFLAHERLIDTIRLSNAHRKKVVKAKSKKQLDVLRSLAVRTPRADLDHLIVERYPVFADALAELDDPLCVVALFATLPAEQKLGIAPARVANCRRLINEFSKFVAHTHALRRVFVSIKGYYYQAEVQGQLLTWVTPHRFSQRLPTTVDYSVMLTFLELYECLLNFVNFRLYTTNNMAYPPKIDTSADAAGHELFAVKNEVLNANKNPSAGAAASDKMVVQPTAAQLEKATQAAVQQFVDAKEEESDDEDGQAVEPVGDESAAAKPSSRGADDDTPTKDNDTGNEVDADGGEAEPSEDPVFSGKVFVVGRETPVQELEFILAAAGAKTVIRQSDLTGADDEVAAITHWVLDRPTPPADYHAGVEYVQPQYVFDSVNAGVPLPVGLYAPGARLPPHLSPFVGDEEDGGYTPWFKTVLERIKAGDETVMADAAVIAYTKGKDAAPPEPRAARTNKAHRHSTEDSKAASIDGNNDGSVEEEEKDEAKSEEEEEEEDSENDTTAGGDGDGEADDADVDDAEQKERELKLLMLSRKKMKQYARYAREEEAKKDRKKELLSKRDKGERAVRQRDDVPRKRARHASSR